MKNKNMILLITTLVGLYLPANNQETSPTEGVQSAMRVRCSSVSKNTKSRILTFTAPLKSRNRTALGFAVAGRILTRDVHIGDSVNKGQTLATIEDQSYRNAYKAIKAEVQRLTVEQTKAGKDYNRVKALFEGDAATREELDAVQAYRDSMNAGLQSVFAKEQEALHLLEECSLIAPFDATIAEVLMQAGEFGTPGKPVLLLTGAELEMEIRVPESILCYLQENRHVTVSFPLAKFKEIKGTIRHTGQSNYGANKLFPVLIEIPNSKNLRPGLTAEAHLEIMPEDGFSIPLSAVINPSGLRPQVLEVKEGKIRVVPITVHRITGNQVSIKGDLTLDSRLVTSSQSGLLDGDLVEEIK